MNEMLTELAPSLQRLIDARLDSIDRALLSTDSSRAERRQIVAAIEDQIQELITRLGNDPTREDILKILASLDPPEAYGWSSAAVELDQQLPARSNRIAPPSNCELPCKANALAIISICLAVMGLSSLSTVMLLDLLSFITSLAFCLPAFVLGIISLRQIAAANGTQSGKGLAILGIVSLPMSFFIMCMLFVVYGE